jgi:hypothetical protein
MRTMHQRSLPFWTLLLAAAFTATRIDAAVSAFEELNLTLGTGIVIDSPETITRVSTSAPEVVDAVTASSREVLFHAKEPMRKLLRENVSRRED